MNVYMYRAALYCEDCGERIRRGLRSLGRAPADPDDEHTYDSDDYPKGPYADGGGESDTVEHCDAHDACINALRVRARDPYTGKRRTYRVGAWLENPLTEHGVEYVRHAIREPRGLMRRRWARWYAKELSA